MLLCQDQHRGRYGSAWESDGPREVYDIKTPRREWAND
jgi:hypothetical protein